MAVWTTVATALAEMQVASFGQTLHLVDAGCRDARVGTLLEQIEPFLEAMAELMERQTQESPRALSRSELLTLRTQLQDILSETNSQIPNAIGHLDFNFGNIVASDDRCVFLDWAEACAGHPFLTFQYLLQHLVVTASRTALGYPPLPPRIWTGGGPWFLPKRSRKP